MTTDVRVPLDECPECGSFLRSGTGHDDGCRWTGTSQPKPLSEERLAQALRAYLDEFRYIDISSLDEEPELAAFLAAYLAEPRT